MQGNKRFDVGLPNLDGAGGFENSKVPNFFWKVYTINTSMVLSS